MEESCYFDALMKKSGGQLNISPLRVCATERKIDQKGTGDFFLLEEGRDDRAGKKGDDEESWRYSCLAIFC